MRTLRRRSAQRRGTAVVETAVVLPVYVLLVLAIIEFGHATMVINLLQSGCRTAARMGSMQGPNTDQAIAKVRQTLGTAIDPERGQRVRARRQFDGFGRGMADDRRRSAGLAAD